MIIRDKSREDKINTYFKPYNELIKIKNLTVQNPELTIAYDWYYASRKDIYNSILKYVNILIL